MLATVPVRMIFLSCDALHAGHVGHRFFQRELDFRQRRNGHPQRQLFVEHMVFAHVGVGQHVVAELLALPQAGAVAEHHPRMCGRSTATWSVMVLALAGPTPMLTIVMPL